MRYLNINSADQTSSLSKLASGSRITQASDDAAGLAISTRISSDVTALTQAATNSSHGVSVLQTADGGASNISDILQRMKALASQSSSGTVTDTERAYIDAEFSQLIDEVDGIATSPTMPRYGGAKGTVEGIDVVTPWYLAELLGIHGHTLWTGSTNGMVTQAFIDAAMAVASGVCRHAIVYRALHVPAPVTEVGR